MVKGIEITVDPIPKPCPNFSVNTKINEIKQIMIMCPATMLAKRRMINAPGLINTALNNSTGTKMNFTPNGTPGGLKI